MYSPGILEILLWTIIIFISLIMIFLISSAIVQKINEYIMLRTYREKSQQKRSEEQRKQERKVAPSKLKMLMQPQNKELFEKFIKLLDDIYWPEYPDDLIEENRETHSLSPEELEDYEEELEEAIEEEDKMYSLYSKHLRTKNILVSKTELSNIVDLYKTKSKSSKN